MPEIERCRAPLARLVAAHNADPLDDGAGGVHIKEWALSEVVTDVGEVKTEAIQSVPTWCLYAMPHWGTAF